MKKLRREKLRFQRSAALKRHLRSIRQIPPKRIASPSDYGIFKVFAPPKIDIYSPSSCDKFLNFLRIYRNKCRFHKKVQICLRNTTRITAAACLLLYAETDRLLKNIPGLSISCSLPPSHRNSKFKVEEYIVESALKQVGFFTLIGQKSRQIRNYASVAYWRQLSGNLADGSLAASLFNSLPAELDKFTRGRLYRGAFEAMANCVEHAHPTTRADGLNISDNRWWMFIGIKDNNLSILVCDLGVGIPNTIGKHGKSLISTISKKIGINQDTDADLIHASTFVKRTRTQQGHRGKGGPDLRSIVETFPSAFLSIRSNRGRYVMKGPQHASKAHRREKRNFIPGTNGNEWKSNQSESIFGTIVEWNLSLKDMHK